MAALCKGRIPFRDKRLRSDSEETAFSTLSLFSWINGLFMRPDPRFYPVGRTALEALLYCNPREPGLLDTVINEWCARARARTRAPHPRLRG